jgi:uncharacterized CHY-type Zn-finger protein
MSQKTPEVCGVNIDSQTRCSHYGKSVDIVAIKMKCCGLYYACRDCHIALADHVIEVWPRSEWGEKAVLCGACGAELTVRGYLDCGHHCPVCKAEFNAACRNHYHYYFEGESI